MDDTSVARIQNNPAFIALVNTRKSFAWTLTILMLVIYFGFIALVAFAPSVIGTPISGSITWGLALGIAVIVSAIALTGVYVWRANGSFDEMTRAIVANNAGGARK
jgi:uncharacterized membrane protein (DUF485 family)